MPHPFLSGGHRSQRKRIICQPSAVSPVARGDHGRILRHRNLGAKLAVHLNDELEFVGGDGFFKAIVGFAFAYEGWILATSINAELKDSKKNLPRALVLGALVTIILYALYIWSMSAIGDVNTIIATWPFGEKLPQIAFDKVFGGAVGTIVYVFITISCLGTMNGLTMASCRVMVDVG